MKAKLSRKPNAAQPAERSLEGITVGISVALGEDSATAAGAGEDVVNGAIVRLSAELLARGARLVFGHDWRPDGIMSAVGLLAANFEPGTEKPRSKGARQKCRITNLVPWPEQAGLASDLRDDLERRGILRIEEVAIPWSMAAQEGQFSKSALRAASLTLLRRRLTELCDARVCLGGKLHTYQGFLPGIVEEAFLTATQGPGRPVLISGLLGGAAKELLRAARADKADAWNVLLQINPAQAVRRAFDSLRTLDKALIPDLPQFPNTLGWSNLQKLSGLNPADWQRLADASDIEVVIAYVIKALRKTTPQVQAGDPAKT